MHVDQLPTSSEVARCALQTNLKKTEKSPHAASPSSTGPAHLPFHPAAGRTPAVWSIAFELLSRIYSCYFVGELAHRELLLLCSLHSGQNLWLLFVGELVKDELLGYLKNSKT